MNPSFKRLLGTVLLIATVGIASLMAARSNAATPAPTLTAGEVAERNHYA